MQTLADKLRILLDAEEKDLPVDAIKQKSDNWTQIKPILFASGHYYLSHWTIRPFVDPFKEQKEAFARGEQIQISNRYSDVEYPDDYVETWEDCIPQWVPNRKYRVKPKSIDLDASDFTIHTVIRNHKSQTNIKWIKIVSVTDEEIKIQIQKDQFTHLKNLIQTDGK